MGCNQSKDGDVNGEGGCVYTKRLKSAEQVAAVQWKPQSWMWDVRDDIYDRPLSHIRIPGTHDSGTYAITDDSEMSPDAAEALEHAPSSIIANWSKTQDADVYGQLEAGIRYFDIRLAPRTVNDVEELWVVHGMYSVNFADIVAQIDRFFSEGEDRGHEVLIIDIQQVHKWEREPHLTLLHKVLAPIADRLVATPFSALSTLQELWSRGPNKNNVLVLLTEGGWTAPGAVEGSVPGQPLHLRNTALKSPWPDTADADEWAAEIAALDTEVTEARIEFLKTISSTVSSFSVNGPLGARSQTCPSIEESECGVQPREQQQYENAPGVHNPEDACPTQPLYVTQGVLTPGAASIVKGLLPFSDYIKGMAEELNPKAMSWFQQANFNRNWRENAERKGEDHCPIAKAHWSANNANHNILMVDFFSVGEVELALPKTAGSDDLNSGMMVNVVGLCVSLNIAAADEHQDEQ